MSPLVRFCFNLIFLYLVAAIILTTVIAVFSRLTFLDKPILYILQLGIVFLITVVVSFLITLSELVKTLIGAQTFLDGLGGIYTTPRQENLIIAFVDLKGSTSLADNKDANAFFSALNSFLRITEQCAYCWDGNIHKYVGDCAIITWKLTPENATKACEMLESLHTELQLQQADFIHKYGQALECTAGVHCGPVTIAEVGDTRMEIGYWGDVMNTSARLQSACTALNCEFVVSSTFWNLLNGKMHSKLPWKSFNAILLKGKEDTFDVYGVPRIIFNA